MEFIVYNPQREAFWKGFAGYTNNLDEATRFTSYDAPSIPLGSDVAFACPAQFIDQVFEDKKAVTESALLTLNRMVDFYLKGFEDGFAKGIE